MFFYLYLAFTIFWTFYMTVENYFFVRPQGRPYFIGFLITHLILAPLSFSLSVTGGVLLDRLLAAYGAAFKEQEDFQKSGRKKLIG